MPRTSLPFVPPRYDNSAHTRRMSEFIRQAGDDAANYALRKGDIAANLGSNLADIASSTIQGLTQYAAEKPQREADALVLQQKKDAAGRENAIRDVTRKTPPDETTGRPDLARIAAEVQRIDPIAAVEFWKAADAETQATLATTKQHTEALARVLAEFEGSTKKLDPRAKQAAYTAMRDEAIASGSIGPNDAPEQYSPAFIARTVSAIRPLADLFKRMEDVAATEGFTLSPGQTRFDAQGNPVASIAPPPEKPTTPAAFTLSPGSKRFDAEGKVIAEVPDRPTTTNTNTPRPMTQTAESELIARLTRQWTAASTPARDLDRQVKLMDTGMEAVKRGDLAQGSQMVLVTFQKILDPPSVVRESEFMRSAAGQSLMNRVSGAVERLTKGGAGVTAAELQKFAQLAREAAQAQNTGYLQAVKKRIGLTADRYQIPHELVFEDYTLGGSGGGGNDPMGIRKQ